VALVLIRYGEIGLKSRYVRKRFEELLVADIKKALRHHGIGHRIRREWGRIFVDVDDFDAAVEPLKNVFGITSFSRVVETEADLESIAKTAAEVGLGMGLDSGQGKTFAIRARRTGNHDFTSQDVATAAGKAVQDATRAAVELNNPDREIFVEVRDDRAFIFSEKIKGAGGMPYGSQGRVAGVVEDRDGLTASLLMMRRGCIVEFVCREGSMAEAAAEACMWRDAKIHVVDDDMYKFAEGLNVKAIVTAGEKFEKRRMPVFYPLLGFREVAGAEKLDDGGGVGEVRGVDR